MLALPRSHAGGDCTSERSSCLPQREERIASRAEAVVHLLKVLQRFPGRGHHLVGPPQRRRRRTRRLRAAPHRAAANFPGKGVLRGVCERRSLRLSNQSFTFGFYREAEECPNLEAYQILYTRSAISVGKGFTPKNG